jgi:hypothetical protein
MMAKEYQIADGMKKVTHPTPAVRYIVAVILESIDGCTRWMRFCGV